MDTNDKTISKNEVLSPPTKQLKRKRTWFLVLAAILAIILGPYALSRCQSSDNRIRLIAATQSENDTPAIYENSVPSLVVATFNIAHGRGTADGNWSEPAAPKFNRIAKIAAKIREIDADVVVLNEVDFVSTWSGHQNQAAAIAESAGYPYRVEQRNLDFRFIYGSFRFGNAILSRYPIADAQAIDFPPEKNWEDWLVGCKRGVVASVRLNQSQRIRIAAVHLEHRSEKSRVAGAKKILELVDRSGNNPLVAAGDFNSTPAGFPKSIKDAGGQNAMDGLLADGLFHYRPTSTPTTNQFTFSTMNPGSVIDWILVADGNQVGHESPLLRYDVVDTDLSDHRLVVAEIALSSLPAAN